VTTTAPESVPPPPDPEQHRGLERELAAPHRADPVEELDAGGHRYQERQEREERQQHGPGGEHVVRPHGHGQAGDRDRRPHHALVAEQGLAREHRDDLGDDAEERQRHDVDLGVAEEPEQVLPQDRAAVLGVEHVRAQHPVGPQGGQRPGEHGESDEHHQRGEEDVPREDRHPEHGHPGRAHADDRGDEVDRGQERATAVRPG
jgi:hypothetical protein